MLGYFILLCNVAPALVSDVSPEHILFNTLLESYEKSVRPLRNLSSNVRVAMNPALYSIMETVISCFVVSFNVA